MSCASWGALQLIIFQVEGLHVFRICSMQVVSGCSLLRVGCFVSFLSSSSLFQVVSGCFLLVVGRFRPFLARCSSFQVISCSLQVVSDRFLFVIGCFRTFQVVLGRFRSFRVSAFPRFRVSAFPRFRVSRFRVSVSTVFSQYFLVTSRKVMKTREAPDVWRLYKNMNCAFPLMILLNSLYFSTKQFFPQKSLVYQTV